MKFYVAVIFLCLAYNFSTTNISAKSKTDSAENVLKKVSDKLSSLKTLNYTFRRELNYESSGFLSKMQIESFLDFTAADKIIGSRFQFDEPNFIFVFNGSEYFLLNKKTKTIIIKNKPSFNDFESLPGFYDSLVTLKNSLPKIISDKTIPKTITEKSIDDKSFYVVEFTLDSKILTLSGNYFVTTPRKFTYRLTIDKSNYLPLEVFRVNDVNKDFTQTNFEYKKAKSALPTENSWYYSTYLNEYKPEKPRENKLINVGQNALEWKLPSLSDEAPVSLSQYKNKVVLLEFWISFCGYCIAAVPKLNFIEEKYKNKDFKLVAINADDTKDIIQKFEKNNQAKFQILYGGKETAESYGIDGFPTIVLIDKTGKVIYSGVFEPNKTDKLEELIDKNL
jgi:thiol-disulfide isomerase/thioredoxin